MRFTADLADGGHFAYGFDVALGGFWVEVRRRGRRKAEYDALHPGVFEFDRPLHGALYFCVQQDVFTEADLHEALLYLEAPTPSRLRKGVKLAAEVVANLKLAAAD